MRCYHNEVTHPDDQNVVIVGERNDEDHAVPSDIMKLLELTDVEVDEMILVTNVDESQCFEQIVDVPVPQIAERIVEVVTALHRSESQNESWYRSSCCAKYDTKPRSSRQCRIRQRSDKQRSISLTSTSRFLMNSTSSKRSMCP